MRIRLNSAGTLCADALFDNGESFISLGRHMWDRGVNCGMYRQCPIYQNQERQSNNKKKIRRKEVRNCRLVNPYLRAVSVHLLLIHETSSSSE